jgi:NAD(P)-dependent dehydrogenase (short-subunit alcohol dehydrogenase family)
MPVAIVTGASRGLGRAVALRLAQSGWDLVVDARGTDALHQAAAQMEKAGATVRALAGDLADDSHRRALVQAAEELGGVDLLVNSAGTLGPSPLPPVAELEPDALRQILEVNVVAQMALVQNSLSALRRAGGTVVAVTSDAAVEGYEGWGGYGASKAALEQLHHVLGTEETAITVYRFDPGDMRTQMHQDAFPGEDISDRADPDEAAAALLQLLERRPPSGRYRAAEVEAVPA